MLELASSAARNSDSTARSPSSARLSRRASSSCSSRASASVVGVGFTATPPLPPVVSAVPRGRQRRAAQQLRPRAQPQQGGLRLAEAGLFGLPLAGLDFPVQAAQGVGRGGHLADRAGAGVPPHRTAPDALAPVEIPLLAPLLPGHVSQ